ncbi:TPA: S1 domain-containing protein [Streptococcus suis]
MKIFKSLKKTYPDLEHVVTSNGLKLLNRYKSSIYPGMVDWTESMATTLPENLERFVSLNGRSFSRHDFGNSRKEAAAMASIIACRVVDVIDSAIFLDRKNERAIFEDVVVCQPINQELLDLRIYVYQSKAGGFQPENIKELVGQLVPVKIVNIIQTQVGRRFEKGMDVMETRDKYVVLGDIDIASYLLDSQVVNELQKAELEEIKDAPIHDPRTGLVVYVTNKGVFVLTSRMERAFIPFKQLSYKYKSPIYNNQEIYRVGEKIEFRFATGELRPLSRERIQLGMRGPIPLVIGERISLEENPENEIKRIIDSGRGTVASGYITRYHEIKGHLFEIDGAYGYQVRLQPNEKITKKMFKEKKKISVVLSAGGSYEYKLNSKGERYLAVRATVTYNSSYTKPSVFEDFFE